MNGPVIQQLPKCDLKTVLAQTRVYRRFLPLIDEAIRAEPDNRVLGVAAMHSVRMQRLAEGIAAFSTACVVDEVRWIIRPCLEIFASQCVLQFVKIKDGEHPDERARLYGYHSDNMHRLILEKHRDWPGHTTTAEERDLIIQRLSQVNAPKWKLKEPWHRLDLKSALGKGLPARDMAIKVPLWQSLVTQIPIMLDFMNAGIHGSPFTGKSLLNKSRIISDNRSHDADFAGFPSLLANASLEMTAFEFGKHLLVQPMLLSALDEIGDGGILPSFPTVTLGLDS